MRATRFLSAILLSGLVLAACAASAQPGWTYAPPPPETPAPSAASSVAPSGAASGDASSAPSVAPSPGMAGMGAALQLSASGVQFLTAALEAPAGQGFQIAFDNQDAGIPHNVQIKDASGALVFDGARVDGPNKVTYDVPALKAGAYTFNCLFHPNMVGTLTVK